MTDYMQKFIETNISLLEQRLFVRLFNECETRYRKELLEILDSLETSIVDAEPASYYAFGDKSGNKMLYLTKVVKNGQYNTDLKAIGNYTNFLVVACPDLREAMTFAHVASMNLYPLNSRFTSKYEWTPIRLEYWPNTVYTTTNAVEYLDPVNIKTRLIQDAARTEYSKQIREQILNRLYKDREQLRQQLEQYITVEGGTVSFTTSSTSSIIVIDTKTLPENDVISLIKKSSRFPVNVTTEERDSDYIIYVEPYGPKVDSIKAEVEDIFGVEF